MNPIAVLNNARSPWQALVIGRVEFSSVCSYLLLMPLLPAASWYVGTSYVGWQVGGSNLVKLVPASALTLSTIMYLSMISLMVVVGFSMCWMARTYSAVISPIRAVQFASFISTPFFFLGLSGLYPIFWLDLFLLIIGMVWSLSILYSRLPEVMHIDTERGFMFSSAIVAVGIVAFITLVVMSVLFWGLVSPPLFTD